LEPIRPSWADDDLWVSRRAKCVNEWPKKELGFKYRKADYLASIWLNLLKLEIDWRAVQHIGWTKLAHFSWIQETEFYNHRKF
jgi:hypothetical protein